MTFEQQEARRRVQARVDEAVRRSRRAASGLTLVEAVRREREAGNPVRCLADFKRLKAGLSGGDAA